MEIVVYGLIDLKFQLVSNTQISPFHHQKPRRINNPTGCFLRKYPFNDMVLSNSDIKQELSSGDLEIDPYPEKIDTSAVDLKLSERFKVWPDSLSEGVVSTRIDLYDYDTEDEDNDDVNIFDRLEDAETESDGSIIMRPEQHNPLIGFTKEVIKLEQNSRISARVQGRSSFARMGLFVHLTAPIIHAGFKGPIALELYNIGPFELKLKPGDLSICQVVFERLDSRPKTENSSRFRNQ